MFSIIRSLPSKRLPWLLLAATALALELSGFFFQYVMLLNPCVMCVYERTAIMGIFFAGIMGAINPKNLILRNLGFVTWLGSAAWGLKLAIEHTGYQLNPSPFATCDFFASYPSWFKLDVWFPFMFEPNGFCDEISWSFLGWSMPQWLIPIFAAYICFALFFSVLQQRHQN